MSSMTEHQQSGCTSTLGGAWWTGGRPTESPRRANGCRCGSTSPRKMNDCGTGPDSAAIGRRPAGGSLGHERQVRRHPASASARDRLSAPLVHQDGGAEGVQRVLEECEVVRAPEQRTALHHHGLDHRTSWATVTKVSGCQGPGRFLVERSLHFNDPSVSVWRFL